MTGRMRPPLAAPFAGSQCSVTEKRMSKSEPMMNDGIDTKAVVMTMMMRSKMVLRRSAATDPKRMPVTVASTSAIRPIFAEVFMPSRMMVVTSRPRCLSDGPKSKRSAPMR